MVKMLLGTFNMIINVDICYLDILLHRIFYRYNIKDNALSYDKKEPDTSSQYVPNSYNYFLYIFILIS